jgi:nitrogen fixation NifU-like protein
MTAGESDLQDLYQEVILDHNKRPHNFRAIEDGRKAEGYNPLCGDRVTVYLRIEDGRVVDASFQGSGRDFEGVGALMTDTVKERRRCRKSRSCSKSFRR